MYEAEVKLALVRYWFNSAKGWRVRVHLDPMEVCRGGQHPEGKLNRVCGVEAELARLGAEVGIEHSFRVDIRAEHPTHGLYLVEAKGQSAQQKELAFYSAIGQLLVKIGDRAEAFVPALAFPAGPEWQHQVAKLPRWLIAQIGLKVLFASEDGVVEWVRNDT